MQTRPGTKLIYEVKPGEQFRLLHQPWLRGAIAIVAHPDRAPRLVMFDGSTEELLPKTLESKQED